MIFPMWGNIFDFVGHANFVINPTNCKGPMGAGLAKQFAEYYPHMEERYKEMCKAGSITIGRLYIYPVTHHSKIINLPTKYDYRKSADEGLIRAGLKSLVRLLELRPDASCVIPLLGAGLGGLSVDTSLKIINEELSCLKNPIIVMDYKLPKKKYYAIVGGRNITDYAAVEKIVLHDQTAMTLDPTRPFQSPSELVGIVSGGAKGVDTLAEQFAKKYDLEMIVIPAEWDLYKKAAGYMRNCVVARLATAASAIVNQSSKGTFHTVGQFRKLNIPYRLTYVDKHQDHYS